MVILIAGDTHTGKTLLAQKLLEKYKYPYWSIDHLKMGLIRSGQCKFSAESSDVELTNYLWPIVREIIKTCIENSQNMIIEGCYIPFGWDKDFALDYLKQIRYVCLIFSRKYIENNISDIMNFENVIEKRLPADLNIDELKNVNERNLNLCKLNNYNYVLIDEKYQINVDDCMFD